jgi:hypothetical protein
VVAPSTTSPHDLVARNQQRSKWRQVSFDDVQIGATNSASHNPKHEMSSLNLWTGNILKLKERSGFATRRCENGCFHPLFSPSPVAKVVVKQKRNGDSPLNLAVRQLPLMSKTEQIADYVDVMLSSVPLIKSILWPVDCSELSVSAYERARSTLVFQEMFACL